MSASIAGHVAEKIKQVYGDTCRVEGLRQGDWVVVDAVDVIIHIFRPEVREFYNLEKLWSVTMPAHVEPASGLACAPFRIIHANSSLPLLAAVKRPPPMKRRLPTAI